jgi:mRNA interferase MazF
MSRASCGRRRWERSSNSSRSSFKVAQISSIGSSTSGRTALCVPLTSNLKWESAPGNVLLTARQTGLPKDSVANVSLTLALDRDRLTERVGRLSHGKIDLLLRGIDLVLGR